MDSRSEIIRVKLDDDQIIQVQARVLGGEENVAVGLPSFKDVAEAIEGIAKAVSDPISRIKPQKASVEFGIEVAFEAGKLTALLVNGSSTASLTITLEWGGE